MGMWKGLGWSAIIYIAAITGVDQGFMKLQRLRAGDFVECGIYGTQHSSYLLCTAAFINLPEFKQWLWIISCIENLHDLKD